MAPSGKKVTRKPDQIVDPNNPVNMINQAPFPLSVDSLKRLKIAASLVCYYENVATDLTAANICCLVLKSFEVQMKVFKNRKKEEASPVPKPKKCVTVPKWNASTEIQMKGVFGARNSTLLYLLRLESQVPMPAPTTVTGHSHALGKGSVETGQVMRLSHTHPLYSNNNANVYRKLEETTRGSTCEASIKPFALAQNGRGVYQFLMNQHAGKDKWQATLSNTRESVQQRKWNWTTSYSLENHVNKCINCYVECETAAKYIPDQVPNPETRVQNLLTSIEGCTDPKIAAASTAVRLEQNSMLNDWEKAITHLFPACLVATKARKKRKNVNISPLQVTTADFPFYVLTLSIFTKFSFFSFYLTHPPTKFSIFFLIVTFFLSFHQRRCFLPSQI